jgi:hypothetical protein
MRELLPPLPIRLHGAVHLVLSLFSLSTSPVLSFVSLHWRPTSVPKLQLFLLSSAFPISFPSCLCRLLNLIALLYLSLTRCVPHPPLSASHGRLFLFLCVLHVLLHHTTLPFPTFPTFPILLSHFTFVLLPFCHKRGRM